MTEQDKVDLTAWCRKVEFYDQDEDGCGEIGISFKIRDEPERMRRIFASMSRKEAFAILAEFVEKVAMPCEGFSEDWEDDASGFNADFGWDEERGEIEMSATFRT